MPVVMTIDDDDAPPEFNHKFVAHYNPRGETLLADGNVLECTLAVTDDVEEAAHFPTLGSALNYWTQEGGIGPDGERIRPLCAWNVYVEAL